MILRNSIKDPRKTSKDQQRNLAMAGVDIDSPTVRKRLVQAGRIARSLPKKQSLTDVVKKNVSFGQKNINIGERKSGERLYFRTRAILRCMVTDHSS